VEADNLIEERLGNRGGRVGVAEVDKMCILGEVIHHGEDDRLAIDIGESFDEVHRDIRPNRGGNRQWLKEARGGAAVHFCRVSTPHKPFVAMQGLLDAFVVCALCTSQDHRE
jgi:hypothetical protein